LNTLRDSSARAFSEICVDWNFFAISSIPLKKCGMDGVPKVYRKTETL
jgi:hypothetical protein